MINSPTIRLLAALAGLLWALSAPLLAAEPVRDAPGIAGEPMRLTETDTSVLSVEDEQADALIDPVTDAQGDTAPAADAPADEATPAADTAARTDADPGENGADDTEAMPLAPDVDLSEPILVPEPETSPLEPALPEPALSAEATPAQDEPVAKPLVLLGEEVAPGTSARLSWSPDQHFDGIAVPTPVLVVNGAKLGKTLCLTAAVHGDELNGIEIVRRVLYDLDPAALSGAVIGVPIVNLQGFRRGSRYLPDRRDLNRFFPGNPDGSSASRIADSFFREVVRHCDALVDIHTGSFLRTNLPQLRADMTRPEVAALTKGFGATAVLHSAGTRGTLRRAATDAGIPAVTLETGEPSRLQDKEIEHGTKGILTLLNKLDLVRRVRVWGDPEPVYYQSTWVRAGRGGLLFGNVKLGQRVREGTLLGTITDPITNVRSELRAPVKGRILGMALNQVVLPGFAAYRIGIPSNDADIAAPSVTPMTPGTETRPPQDDVSTMPDPDSEEENSE